MKVTRSREVRINLGNYEHVATTASVETEFDDEVKLDSIAHSMDKILDGLLESDIKDAKDSSSLDESESFVYTWTEIKYGR